MIRRLNIGLTIAFLWVVAPLEGLRARTSKPRHATGRIRGRATDRHRPATRARPTPAGPDFKVVFWFDGVTSRHQVYDVRRGQYTKAVED